MSGWLGSVRNAGEARQVLAAGARLIDCKEPGAGALGALDRDAVAEVLAAVAGRAPVSATVGDFPAMAPAAVAQAVAAMAGCGVDYVKIGLFPGPNLEACLDALAPLARTTPLVAVLFADLDPDFDLLPGLAGRGFAGVMLDTAGKGQGRLTDHQSHAVLRDFVRQARDHGLLSGLAGSLRLTDLPGLLPLGADYLGFRGALCRAGSRTEALDPLALAALAKAMACSD